MIVKLKIEASKQDGALSADERTELHRLRRENKHLRHRKGHIKKGFSLVRQRNEIKHQFIQCHSAQLPVNRLCQMVGLSRSSYYAWVKRPALLISAEELQLYRRAKALFAASRQSLGSRELMKKLREEGFSIGRYRTKTVMRKLGGCASHSVPPIESRQTVSIAMQ